MKNQKLLIGAAVVVILIGVGGFFAWQSIAQLFNSEPTEQTKKKSVVEQVNVLPVADRPYLQLSPTADGRNVIILVKALKEQAQSVEYLLEYETGSLLQGVQGELSLATVPAQTQQLLGSCSAGGKCTYHEDVSGGKIETTYRGGSQDFKLKQDWRYIDNAAGESAFASRDGKFQVTSEDLADQRYLIVLNSPGYPETPSGTVVSDPYALAVSSTLTGTGTIAIRAQEAGELTIQGWDGSEWQSFETVTEDKTATASDVPLMELYIVTK